MKKHLWVLVALAGLPLLFALDRKACNCSFVFDDWPVIEWNQAFHSASPKPVLEFNPFRAAVYYSIWRQGRGREASDLRRDASGLRKSNICLHWLAGLIVMCLTFILAGRKKLPALLAGFLFWLNPVFLEAVNFILGRTELMLAIFYLGALCFYLSRKRPWVSGAGFFICFALALLCKEVAVTLPAAALLLSLFRAEKWKRVEVVGGMVLVVVFVILRLNWTIELAKSPELTPSWPSYFLDQNRVFWLATLKTLIPLHLNFDYQLGHHFILGIIFLASNFILFTFVFFVSLRRERSGWLILVYALIYLPLALVPLADPLRESRLYLPGAWLVIVFSLAFFSHLGKNQKAAAAMVGIIFICLGLLSLKRAQVWSSEPVLWKDALDKSPEKFRPAYNYATGLRNRLELKRAKQVYLWAKSNDPENEKVDWALDLIEQAQRYPEKIEQLKRSLESNSEKP
jgi:hypothetical protein